MVKNAFVMFVGGAGGTEFLRRHGRKPDLTRDTRSLGDLYQEISEEDRSYYKMLAKGVRGVPPRTIVFRNAAVTNGTVTGTVSPANDPAGGKSGQSSPRNEESFLWRNPEAGPNKNINCTKRAVNMQQEISSLTSAVNYPPCEWAPYVFGRRTRCPRSAPVNAYVIFVNGVGGAEFVRRHGRKPDMAKDGHLLDELYQEISEADRLYLKNLAKGNVDMPQRPITFNRNAYNSVSSGSSSAMIPVGTRARQDPVVAGQTEKPVVRRTPDVKPPANLFTKFSVDMHKFQFISIYNYVYQENTNNTKTIYPAEIAVISFSLKKGVFEKDVIRVNFSLRDEDDNLVERSKREFFNGYPNEAVEEKLHTTYENNKARAGYGKNVGCSFKDALLWLVKKFSIPGRINVLDKSDNSETLRTIYHMFEVNGSFAEKKKINIIRFYSFDDIISMIMESPCKKAVSTYDISNYFTKMHTFTPVQVYCPDHRSLDRTVDGFYACPVFSALSKIQMFFDFCDDVGVCEFSRRSVQNIHDYVFFQEHRMSSNRRKISLQLNGNEITSLQTESMSKEACDTVLRFRVMSDEKWNELFTLKQVPDFHVTSDEEWNGLVPVDFPYD